ncbi:40S ribosomal protein [Actinidia chinensis var. chinensis]|uniref:40S ribosomal protein n=1 Tax=Actinidia chinensis var. chinensis TaxID=1590841 RepID=A0A2R6RQJ6_ACTCC|nr:40S ribosomal protein [Actinidia chinensis var. chinensis]
MENPGFLNEKLDLLAMWVGSSVASAFFASLGSCACVNLTTSESDDEDEEEANDRPLMFTNHQINVDNANNRTSVDDLPV